MEEASQAIVGGLAASAVGLVAVGLGALALTSGYQSSAKDSAERSVESAYQISVVANELPAIGESRTVLISHQGDKLTCDVASSEDGFDFDCFGPEGPVDITE